MGLKLMRLDVRYAVVNVHALAVENIVNMDSRKKTDVRFASVMMNQHRCIVNQCYVPCFVLMVTKKVLMVVISVAVKYLSAQCCPVPEDCASTVMRKM